MSDPNPLSSNQLIHATSPYLLQHAGNPVHWQQYGDEAFKRAVEDDKPLLISIGYAACHWCHVMEHESFEDQQVADFMNEHFVCIKVDREELPHVDHYYMTACQVITGQGGWPLNMFVTPDGRPFTGGTYYPPEPRYGRPSWMDVLSFVRDIWKDRRQEVMEQAEKLSNHVRNSNSSLIAPAAGDDLLALDTAGIFRSLMGQADQVNGGWGNAPKFPAAMTLQYLLKAEWFEPDDQVSQHLKHTLSSMHKGGIWDQLGGGFSRYTVDAAWLIPHFEKMLYDNALLLETYALAYGRWKEADHLLVVEGIMDFADQELAAADGGFFASLDADSEGEEGKYYVWTKEAVREVLGEDADAFCSRFDIRPTGNWEGKNILHRNHPAGNTLSATDLEPMLEKMRKARAERVRPGLDDKVLVSWNALYLHGMLTAYRATGRRSVLDSCIHHTRGLLSKCMPADQLMHAWCKGVADIPANLDDHAAMIRLTLGIFGETGDKYWYDLGLGLTEQAMERYRDPEGSLYFDHAAMDSLPDQTREVFDYAQPSGNALLATCFHTLFLISGEQFWYDRYSKLIAAVHSTMMRFPQSCGQWLQSSLPLHYPVAELVVAGPEASALLLDCHQVWHPLVLSLPVCDNSLENLPISADRFDKNVTRIFLCKNMQCATPVSTVSEYSKLLKAF